MRLIKNLLMDLEYYGALNSVDEYIAEKEVDGGSVIQKLIFAKSAFADKDIVREWIETNFFEVYTDMEETDTTFIVEQLNISEVVESSLKDIEIRDGVIATVGVLKADTMADPFAFSLRNEKSIKLNSDLPHVIEIAKVVKGYHPSYGEVEITTDMLKNFIQNFNDNVYGIDLSIDYDHDVREAAGWVRGLFLDFSEQVLYAEVKWTPKGAVTLTDREFRYFSPEFTTNYIHPHTGAEHGPTLLGGALVNRPFLKMDAIVSLKDKNINRSKQVETIKISEHTSIVDKKDEEIKTLQLSVETGKTAIYSMKEENVKLSEELETFKSDKEEAERVAGLDKLFSENKINKAQYELMKEKKDATVVEIVSLTEKMNPEADGESNPKKEDITLSDQEREVCLQMGLTPSEFIKFNK